MKRSLLFLQCILLSTLSVAQEYYGANTYGGGGIDTAYQTCKNSDGTIYIPGLFQTSLTVGPDTITSSGGNADAYVSFFGENGEAQGVLKFGGGFDDVAVDVTIDVNNNIYLTGYFQGAGSNSFDADPGPDVYQLEAPSFLLSRDCFIIKLDSNHDFVWAKQISNPFGAANEDSKAISVDQNGNVYVAGSFIYADFDPDPSVSLELFSADMSTYDGFLVKLDTDGNFVWVKTFDGPGGLVEVVDMKLDASENIVVTGRFQNQVDLDPGAGTDNFTTNGSYDTFMAKLDNEGNYLWGGAFGGPSLDVPSSIEIIDTDIYLTGMFGGTVDLDPSAGDNTVTSAGDFDGYFSRFDSDGNYISSFVLGGDDAVEMENVYSVTKLINNQLVVTGNFAGTIDFDLGSGQELVTSIGGSDNYILQLEMDATYVGNYIVGGTSNESNPSVEVNGQGHFVSIGVFQDVVDLDPFTGEDLYTSVANRDVYVSHYTVFNTANDDCSGAISMSCGESLQGDTFFDTDNGGNTAPDEFFVYTGSGNYEMITVSLCNNTDFDTVLRVFDDCNLANEIASNDDSCGVYSELEFLSDGTSTYYIMVEGNASEVGNFEITLTCEELPENNFCSGAIEVSCGETITGSTSSAIVDTNAPECSISVDAPGVWYTFTDTSGVETDYIISLCGAGTNYDSKITIYEGDCGTLTCITDNDDSCGTQSEVAFQGNGNTTYYILVHGANGESGDFDLSIDCAPVLGMNDIIFENFSFYPNPSSDNVYLNSKFEEIEAVRLYNMVGQMMREIYPGQNDSMISVADLPAGIYLMTVEINGAIRSYQLMKN